MRLLATVLLQMTNIARIKDLNPGIWMKLKQMVAT